MKELKFEWDEKKSSLNSKKHGISFEDATTCFDDDFAEVFDDVSHSETEDRYLLIGMSLTLKTLVVIFTERDGVNKSEIINRIISARKATKKEFQYYWTRRKGMGG